MEAEGHSPCLQGRWMNTGADFPCLQACQMRTGARMPRLPVNRRAQRRAVAYTGPVCSPRYLYFYFFFFSGTVTCSDFMIPLTSFSVMTLS